jgi:hypothetical protein
MEFNPEKIPLARTQLENRMKADTGSSTAALAALVQSTGRRIRAKRVAGCSFFCHLLPGEQSTPIGAGELVVIHPDRRPVILYRDAAGMLREEVIHAQ